MGDCLEVMKSLDDKSIDMVLTDPPYGTTACKWDTVIPFEPMWKELDRLCCGPIVLFGSEPFSSALRMSNIKKFKYDWIWYKNTQTGISLSKYQPMKSHECLSVFYQKNKTFNKQPTLSRNKEVFKREGKRRLRKGHSDHYNTLQFKDGVFTSKVNPRTVLEFKTTPNGNGLKVHPTQKPVPLLEYLIKTYTLEGETVLDFTMGSGSTGVACKNLNRKFIGIEKDKTYFEIAKARISGA